MGGSISGSQNVQAKKLKVFGVVQAVPEHFLAKKFKYLYTISVSNMITKGGFML